MTQIIICMLASHMLVLTGYTRIDPNFFLANTHESLAYTSSFQMHQCHSETSVLLDCVYNSTYSGISYVSTCTPHGVLCCPNGMIFNSLSHVVRHLNIVHCADTASCGFQLPTSDDITTPSKTPTPTISPTGLIVGKAIVSFGLVCNVRLHLSTLTKLWPH